ncbi:hypothetical protein VTP01DRAFT_6540 [Rhizomucor pusillus]|uniref:uncharacterized protein n=1 Tax=Rhizomucor pusillus TaxID=4840 RepID=UPI003742493C
MQLIKAQSALLSNYEVLRLIEERQQVQNETKAQDPDSVYPENLLTIQHELSEYLKNTPCSTQTPEQVQQFLEAFSQFELTRAEKLQILNLRPRSTVDIYLIIEECEERFGEEDLDSMLNIIATTLPRDDDYQIEEEEEGEDQDMEQEE